MCNWIYINNTYHCNFWQIFYQNEMRKVPGLFVLLGVGLCSLPPAFSAGWTITSFKAHSECCDDFSSHSSRISCACSTFAQTIVINYLEILSLSLPSHSSWSLSYWRQGLSFCLWLLIPKSSVNVWVNNRGPIRSTLTFSPHSKVEMQWLNRNSNLTGPKHRSDLRVLQFL